MQYIFEEWNGTESSQKWSNTFRSRIQIHAFSMDFSQPYKNRTELVQILNA